MREILGRTAALLAGNGVSKALLLGFEFYLAAAAGAGAYGLFAITLATLLVMGQVCLLGLDLGAVRFLAAYQEERRHDKIRGLIQLSFLAVGTFATAAGILLALGAETIAGRLFAKPELAPALTLIALAVPFEALNQLTAAFFRAFRRVPEQLLVSDLVRHVLLAGSLPVLIALGLTLPRLTVVLVAGPIVAFGIGQWQLARRIGWMRGPAARWPVLCEVVPASSFLFGWSLCQALAGRVQVLVAGVFLATADVGVLALLFRLVLVFTFVQTAVNRAAPVEFARLSHLAEHGRLRRLYGQLTEVLLVAATLLAVPMFMYPSAILDHFGPAYVERAALLVGLAAVQVLNVGTGPVGHLLVNTGGHRAVLMVALGGSVVQVGGSIVMIHAWGLAGAAVAEMSTGLFFIGMRHAVAARLLGIHAFTARLLGLVASAAVAVAAGVAAASMFGGLATYAVGLGVAYVVYGVLARGIVRGGRPLSDDLRDVRSVLAGMRSEIALPVVDK